MKEKCSLSDAIFSFICVTCRQKFAATVNGEDVYIVNFGIFF